MDHRIWLDEKWGVWKAIDLRSAGFPVSLLEALGDPGASARVDAYLEQQAGWERDWKALRDEIWALAASGGADWRKWRKLAQELKPTRVPEVTWLPEALRSRIQAAVARRAWLAEERGLVEMQLMTLEEQAWQRLLPVLQQPAFREALAWQNPRILEQLVKVESAAPTDAASRRRAGRLAMTLARYVARYAGKNDHIGFFGPAAWGELTEGARLEARCGDSLIASRAVHFEYWVIDALARRLETDPALRPWLCPRVHPTAHLHDGAVKVPRGKTRSLTGIERRLVETCDGRTPAIVLARRQAWSDPGRPLPVEEVTKVLEALVTEGVLVLTASPPSGPWPERDLRETVGRVPDRAARERLLAPLDDLERRREEIARAAGDASAVLAAQGRLAQSFHHHTEMGPTRNPGVTYGGRGLVYEDCSRQLEISLGRELLARAVPALSLILTSSSWFAAETALRFRRSLLELHRERRARKGSALTLHELLFAGGSAEDMYKAAITGAEQALKDRWAKVLGPPPEGAAEWRIRSADIAARVEEHFPRRTVPWPQARFHSPDLMIAAASPEEASAGRGFFVLGELHPGSNLMMQPVIRDSHPDPVALDAWHEADLLRPVVTFVPPRERRAHRTAPGSCAPASWQLEMSETPGRGYPIRLGSLMVEPVGQGLQVVDVAGSARFDLSEFFAAGMGQRAIHHFRMFSGQAATPRVFLDDMVIQRRSWRISVSELRPLGTGTSVTRFFALRELVRTHGLPRRVFVKSPLELKPVYHDLEGPLSLESLGHLVRALVEAKSPEGLRFAEMLPGPDQCWLLDAQGRRYVSELRFAFLSREEWKPSWEHRRQDRPPSPPPSPVAAPASAPARKTVPLPDVRRDARHAVSRIPGIVWPALRQAGLARIPAVVYQLERTQWMGGDEILESQRRQLERLIRHTWEQVPFYRSRLEEAGFDPQRPLGWDVFHRLPPLARVELLENFETLQARQLPEGHGETTVRESSGSTGQVVRVLYTEPVRLMWNALTLRDHLWHRRQLSGSLFAVRAIHGAKEVDSRGTRSRSWGPPTDQFYRTGPASMFDCRLDPAILLAKAQRLAPRYILTFPSVIEGLARTALEKGITLPSVEHVITISEMLRPEIRAVTRKALGLSIVDMYSSVELGYMALQCPVSENYHIQSESVLVEVVDDLGRPCPPGVMGRVWVTSLLNFGSPLIRYEILDYAELGEKCSCGRGLPVLRNIHGRSRNLIRMPDGSRQRPSLWSDEWSEIAPIRQVQLIQKEIDRFEVLYVMDRGLDSGETARLEKSLTQALGGHALRFSFHQRTELIRGDNGKFELIRSEVAG